jgi:PAS domain S-box-containing protein
MTSSIKKIALVMDQQGMIVDWSPEAEGIFGWPRAKAIGARLSTLIIPLRNREAHEAGLHRFLGGGPGALIDRAIEIIAVDRSGIEFKVEILIAVEKSGDVYRFPASLRRVS